MSRPRTTKGFVATASRPATRWGAITQPGGATSLPERELKRIGAPPMQRAGRTREERERVSTWSAVLPSSRPARIPLRRVRASAPMRISFAGGGTDVPPFAPGVGGRVVGAAIDLRVEVVVEPFERGWVRLEAPGPRKTLTRRRSDPPRGEVAFRLLEAALAATGIDDAVRVRVTTDVGPGAGLGGSASAAIATLGALRASIGEAPDARELAREAIVLERDRLALACGSQDQTFAALGGLLDLRYDERGAIDVAPLCADPVTVEALQAGLLLVDTEQRRVSGEVLARMDPCAALDTAAELVASADDVARGLAVGSLDEVLRGMRRNAAAKARRDPAANAFALDLEQRIEGLGTEVVRACGAGGGGHVLVWAWPHQHSAIASALEGCSIRRAMLGAEGVRIDIGN